MAELFDPDYQTIKVRYCDNCDYYMWLMSGRLYCTTGINSNDPTIIQMYFYPAGNETFIRNCDGSLWAELKGRVSYKKYQRMINFI